MGAKPKSQRKKVVDSMNLSKKTTVAAPTTANLEERLLELKGAVIQWRTDAPLAQQDATKWKARHADLCRSSLSIAVGSILLGVVIGYLFSAWVR
jgi:F0F1-type ATP synthase assembly protein I